jgi:uncharacterized membrane-anchored protein
MNRRQFALVISVPAVVILAFACVNLYTVYTGQEILLKVAPVDPRDLFRGDYINLAYEISRIDLAEVSHDTVFSPGETVYAILSKKEKFWTVDSVYHEKPLWGGDQVCMKGRVTGTYESRIFVEWGIESYFIPEGKGSIIQDMGNAEVSVIVSVNSAGFSVLKELLINDEPVT